MENLNFLNDAKHLYKRIDHVAIAVKALEPAIVFYRDILGFELLEKRTTNGKFSGMISAVMNGGEFTIVLIQGLQPESQVSRFIEQYGPGVQHVAFEVDDLDFAIDFLSTRGIEFATSKIQGDGLYQIFSKREPNSGMMFEIIQRCETTGFQEKNIQKLFDDLEKADLV